MKIKDLVKEKRTRCFIENDITIEDEKDQFEPHFDKDFDKYFDVVITRANQNQDELKKIINYNNDIYISTGFIGASGELMNKMCEYVLANNIKGKRLFNLRKKDFIYYNRIDSNLMNKIFEKDNEYYQYSDNYEEMERVNEFK